MMKKISLAIQLLLFLLVTGMATQVFAQNVEYPKNPNYKKHAYWIQMMDDPNVNFFVADQAFETFWENRGEPEKEGNEEGKHEKNKHSLIKRIFVSEEKLEYENMQYASEYKRFKQWRMDVLPFVQPDGSILSPEEQLEIWKHSRE